MEQLITRIAAAINMRTLYPANHPRVGQTVEQVIAALERGLQEQGGDSVTFLIVGDDLVVGQEILRTPTLSQRQFVEVLKRQGIERLTLAAGLDAEETHTFVATLASNMTPRSSPHIILGRVHVILEDEATPKRQDEDGRELTVDQIEPVREAFANFRTEGELPLASMEQLVWSFIDSLSRTTRSVLPLAKLKEHDEYTFVHSVNVSLLVLAQARSFGIQGAMLHAFGLAALVHDIGKLKVPLEVLNSPGKLEGEQWAMMQSHAVQGALFLSEQGEAPPLSIAVAFEHHLRFDGQPAYPVLRIPRIPNLASRMTSIADAYDAMSTVRPYQKPLLRSAALEILQKRSESFYDPLLVANFTRLIREGATT
jgi:HD-GYP domain-containing protein (c-di-GMP phosphodiesterase class II)